MKAIFYITSVFLCGSVVTANLSLLIDFNPQYQAHWGKVVFAFFLTITSGLQLRAKSQ